MSTGPWPDIQDRPSDTAGIQAHAALIGVALRSQLTKRIFKHAKGISELKITKSPSL